MQMFSTSLVKELQIKFTVMKYPLTPLRMSVIKKISNNKCWQGGVEKGTLVHCWWECKTDTATMEKSIAVPQEITNRSAM